MPTPSTGSRWGKMHHHFRAQLEHKPNWFIEFVVSRSLSTRLSEQFESEILLRLLLGHLQLQECNYSHRNNSFPSLSANLQWDHTLLTPPLQLPFPNRRPSTTMKSHPDLLDRFSSFWVISLLYQCLFAPARAVSRSSSKPSSQDLRDCPPGDSLPLSSLQPHCPSSEPENRGYSSFRTRVQGRSLGPKPKAQKVNESRNLGLKSVQALITHSYLTPL